MLISTARTWPSWPAQSRKALKWRELCRGFKSSPYAAHMNRDMYRSLRHNRHRAYRWAYMASLKREVDSTLGNPDETIKRSGTESEPQNRKTKHNLESWADDLSGVRLGRSIEDVEREAMNHLFGTVASRHVLGVDPGLWRSPLRNIRNYLHSYRAPTGVSPDEILRAASDASAEEETVIDPITNRRVPKSKRANSFTHRCDDVDRYDPGEGPEFEELPKTPLEGTSGQSSALHPDQSPPLNDRSSRATAAEGKSSEREELDSHKHMHWNEPDNLQSKSSEENPEDHQDFHRNKEISCDDPDQPRQTTPKERSESQDHYEESESQKWSGTDRLPENTEEEQSKDYKNLHKYQNGVHSNEPSGLPGRTSEERSKDYEDLREYENPVRWNEPNGLPQLTPEEESKLYQDLASYREGCMAADGMLQHHEHSQRETTTNCPSLPENSSPQGESLTRERDGLNQYHHLRQSDPEGEHGRPGELVKECEDLQKYDPQQFDSAFEPYSLEHMEATQQEKDVNANTTVLGNETDGLPPNPTDPTVDEPESYKSQRNDDDATAFTNHYNDPEAFTAQGIRARVLQRVKEYSDKQNMEASKRRSDLSWDATAQKACEDLHLPKSRGKDGGMTGNYIRDFPEEFSTSWSTSNSASNSSLFPQNRVSSAENKAQETEGEEVEISSMDESFPTESSRLQTALSRGGHKRSLTEPSLAADTSNSYSTEVQGLEESFVEEIPSPSVMTKHSQADLAEVNAVDSAQESTPTKYEYVILAYDPSTQSIQHASTSSSVPDTSTPLSPVDILPRVSNPSKFLPHFDNLLILGYEMVSGNGDVIIFRRTHNASSGAAAEIRNSASSPSIEELAASELLRRLHGRAKPRRRFGRRLLYGTAWVVGGAYAVGVLAEYFSTGGFDGLSSAGL